MRWWPPAEGPCHFDRSRPAMVRLGRDAFVASGLWDSVPFTVKVASPRDAREWTPSPATGSRAKPRRRRLPRNRSPEPGHGGHARIRWWSPSTSIAKSSLTRAPSDPGSESPGCRHRPSRPFRVSSMGTDRKGPGLAGSALRRGTSRRRPMWRLHWQAG